MTRQLMFLKIIATIFGILNLIKNLQFILEHNLNPVFI